MRDSSQSYKNASRDEDENIKDCQKSEIRNYNLKRAIDPKKAIDPGKAIDLRLRESIG